MTPLESRILYRLRTYGPLDVFQLHEQIKANLHGVRVAARALNDRGLVHITTWHKRNGVKRIPVFAAGEGVNVMKSEVEIDDRSYKTQLETTKTIATLRTTVTPGLFDPFRVLRAQVGA